MKLGLIADIHEDVECVRLAIDRFRKESVDTVVVLGDVFTVGENLLEVCALLVSVGALGVWGNHDYLLCQKTARRLRREYSEEVAVFMKSLRPRLQIGGCHFAHVPPFLDPAQPENLWYLDGPPTAAGVLAQVFSAVPHRVIFCGHFHKWLLYTPTGQRNWTGLSRLVFEDHERYFFVIAPAFQKCYAIVDLDSGVLQPFNEVVA